MPTGPSEERVRPQACVCAREGAGHADAHLSVWVCVQTIDQLNVLLDVEKPFTILIHDRTGISEIRPADQVPIETYIKY